MNESVFIAINIFLDLFSIFIGFCIFFAIIKSVKQGNKINLYFTLLCCTVILFTLTDIPEFTCRGINPSWHIPLLTISTFIYYLCQPLISIICIRYLIEYIKPVKISKVFINIAYILGIVFLLGLILTPFFGFYYSFSEDNCYQRGSLYYGTVIINILYYLLIFILLFSLRKNLKLIEKISFYSFLFIPMIFEIIQVFNYGICLISTGLTLSLFLIFINIHIYLESTLQKQTENSIKTDNSIHKMQDKTIMTLSNLVENRTISGGQHIPRICKYVEILAKKTQQDGYYKQILTDTYIEKLIKAAPMHDIGKILIPDNILNKPGKLTPEEFLIMQTHVINADKIVDTIIGHESDAEFIQITKDIAKYHHEKWNGTGYPEQLLEDDIPLAARIMAIADVFDALVSPRVYNNIVSVEYALQIIEEVKGIYFDPILVDEFLLLKDEIKNIIKIYGSSF